MFNRYIYKKAVKNYGEGMSKSLFSFLENYSFTESDIDTVKEDYLPVRFLVTVRTDYTNEVLIPNDGNFFTDCTCGHVVEHPFNDSILLALKSFVTSYFDCGESLPYVVSRTVPAPIGAFVHEDAVYVYITLVIDHNLKSNPDFRTVGCHFEPIKSLSVTNQVETLLKDNLVIVEEDS